MSRPNSLPASFKQRFKLHGMIAAVVVMWLDYVLIHYGLNADDPTAVGVGMVIMILGGAIAYYFG